MKPIYRKAFFLPIKTSVYVPSTYNKNKLLTPKLFQKRVHHVERIMARKYGGYTTLQGTGGYIIQKGKYRGTLVREPVRQIVAFTDPTTFKKQKAPMLRLMKGWNKKWGQEGIGYEVDSQFYSV